MMRPLIKLRGRGVALAVLLGGAPQVAAGQVIPAGPLRFKIGWNDVAVTGGALALAAIPTFFASHLPSASCGPCDPSHLMGFERHFVGVPDERLDRASTAALMVTAFAAGAFVVDAHAADVTRGNKWEDLAVYAQALSVNAAVTAWTKVLVRRPRPARYTASGGSYPDPDDGLSFPSGHSSMAFAAAAAYASILQRRHQIGAHGGEVALLFGTAAATGVLRVVAHKHFPTDALAGAVLGTAIGWVIPRLHPIQ